MKNTCALELFQVDAFTERPFEGNPAAVCLSREVLPASFMKKVASEMNLSETAFLFPIEDDFRRGTKFRIRWFTPKVEVPLCGHATLASASVLFDEKNNPAREIFFESKSGRLAAKRSPGGYTLDFPVNAPHPCQVPEGLLRGLRLTGNYTGWLSVEAEMLLIPLQTAEDVISVSPDFPRLASVSERLGALGIIVTAPGPGNYDFCSRYFGPWEGINEDPVTGSAHTVLAPYWSTLLGKSRFMALQASERSGVLEVALGANGRVELTGKARLVVRGSLLP